MNREVLSELSNMEESEDIVEEITREVGVKGSMLVAKRMDQLENENCNTEADNLILNTINVSYYLAYVHTRIGVQKNIFTCNLGYFEQSDLVGFVYFCTEFCCLHEA